ncbi:hypothetical protein F2Q69_00017523 [Brassica cretica]|uniref:Uncharacterized protein n=1 Tax=Brassica cretica TaxID=69181 RepID=A0A8S9R0A4_BRACR|nr:hypothetical protein F2Q69_00017523 [Brassica cretica]
MDIGGNHNESTSEEKDKASSSVEEAWEEHGCVLWDLATSETHADLMNQCICFIDLLNPPAELEKRKHKLKRLVQSPNSFLLPTVRWADTSSSHEEHPPNIDKRSLQDLLFFLHVPRTGGRTYFHCFLRTLYDNAEECPRSYDKLHFDPRSGLVSCCFYYKQDSSKGYMVAFAGAKYAGRSVPTMVADNDHVVTSFTLVIG